MSLDEHLAAQPGVDLPSNRAPGGDDGELAAWMPGPATASWLERDHAALASVLSRVTDVVAVRGEGSWLVDADGRRWLDFACGIAVTNVGHCHPRVVAAAEQQLRTLMHTSVVTHQPRNIELAERLGRLTPWWPQPQVFFCNTGAEAVEGAIKLSRRVTGRSGIVAFHGGFHGRTMGAVTLTTAKDRYREGYDPLLPGVHHAPYGSFIGLDELWDPELSGAGLSDAGLSGAGLRTGGVDPSRVAAMIVEPVLGEGGYVVPPAGWLQHLRDTCDEHGILLVFDEVQTGFGRTGHAFAAETFGVAPDVVLCAKGIASGLPLAAIIADRSLLDRWPKATHGTTFGGNPVACAAALATLDVLDDERCYERARLGGERIRDALALAASGNPRVVEVRGVGMMIGVELDSGETAHRVQRRCLDAGLIVLTCGPGENVLRLIPPLNLDDTDLAHGVAVLTRAIELG